MNKLNSGYSIPSLGFGTWNLPRDERTTELIEQAILTGYRHVDCAAGYGNEKQVGAAFSKCFQSGIVNREDLFITSKLMNSRHNPSDVRLSFMESLNDLQLEYLDLYLMHWPVALREGSQFPVRLDDVISLDDCPLSSTWTEMEKLVDDGLVRSIGVSNFSAKKLHDLLLTCRIPPAVNQVEGHPYYQSDDLHRYCQIHNIHVTRYSPFGSPNRPDAVSKQNDEPCLLQDPVILDIANKHQLAPAQVLLNWGLSSENTSVLSSTSKPNRLRENLDSLTALVLDQNDMDRIKTLDKNHRYITGEFWVTPGGYYTLENIWDEAITVDSLLQLEGK